MMLFDELTRRGFIDAVTDEEAIKELLAAGKTSLYVGFDPTADSLHAGHLIPIMALGHFMKAGFAPVALIGSATARVGDPSGKTEMRKMLDDESLQKNIDGIGKQLHRLLDGKGEVKILANGDWLNGLKYIDFLRDIGRHFSVNRMLTAESYKMRLERGLSFIEFNYQLLQAYDFWYLFKNHNCQLQMGGADQWGNIVAGIDLIHRLEDKQGYGMTFKLITTATGQKMGKTVAGALWLDENRTSPYDYFQYWVNSDDRDVLRYTKLFTYLPIEEIEACEKLTAEQLNPVKTILAYEATAFIHGYEKAKEALFATWQAFGARSIPADILPSSNIPRDASAGQAQIPTTELSKADLAAELNAVDLFVLAGLCESKGAARRLIQGGGAYINEERIEDGLAPLSADILGGEIILRAGKKKHQRIIIK